MRVMSTDRTAAGRVPFGVALGVVHRSVAALLIAGLLLVPASCAQAAGPHSLFLSPMSDATSDHQRHAHHHPPAASPIEAELAVAMVLTGTPDPSLSAALPCAGEQPPRLTDVPVPAQVALALAATLPPVPTLAFPTPAYRAPETAVVPPGRAASPDTPPPRPTVPFAAR